MNVAVRQRIEREIAEAFITQVLAAGYSVSVNDCEETTLENSTDKAAILGAMFTTDDDRLYVHRANEVYPAHFGWAWFVYGNDGFDVISDYSTNLEPLMTAANKKSESWETKGGL